MSDLPREVAIGHQAERLLNDEVLTDLIVKREADLIKAWKTTDPRDTEGREMAWHAVRELNQLVEGLKISAANGRVAKRDLEALNKD